MDTSRNAKPVFEMSADELEEHLGPATFKAVQEGFDKGLPASYQDERCPTKAHYIHEHADGRIHLVLFDPDKRTFRLVKDLTNA